MPKTGAKVALALLQTDCHAHIGAPFGLGRGKRGSKAKHKAVDKLQAAVGHIQDSAQAA